MSIEIGDFVEVKAENPYDSTIAALIKANDDARAKAIADGKDPDGIDEQGFKNVMPKSVSITIPKEDEKKTKFKVSRAANDVQRTARLRNRVDSEDGTAVTLVFTLSNRHKPRRHAGDTKPKSDAPTAADEETLTEIGSERNDKAEQS